MNRNLRTLFVVLLILAAVGIAAWYFTRPAASASGALTASGTVETTEISIAPELSGKIIEIKVQEGDVAKAGDVLFRLDDTLLKAQRNVAAASLDTAKAAASTAESAVAVAQAQYDSALSTALFDDKTNRTSDWQANKPSDFNQPAWYFNKSEQMAAVQAAATTAQDFLAKARDNLAYIEQKVTSSDFLNAEKRLAEARVAYLVAQDVLDLSNKANDGQDLRAEAQNIFDDAKTELDDAGKAYNDALTTEGAKDVLQARAKFLVAQERYDTTQDHLRAFQTGADSPRVIAAQKALEQAKSAAEQANSAVQQAQANVDLLDAQIAKTVIAAPVDGVILTRVGEPGSVVNPGGTVLVLGRLDELTITVYVPEDRMGEVALGQVAMVTVDSFPGEKFTAAVTFISDQAEFTPRNVQTVEGRKNTVFAVKLKLDNTSGKLKPGMPADVTFSQK